MSRFVDLEAIFLEQLKHFFADPERIAGHIRKANDTVSEKEQLLAVHQAEAAKAKEQMTRTQQIYLDQAIDSAGFKELYTPQQERLRQLQEHALHIQSELRVASSQNDTGE